MSVRLLDDPKSDVHLDTIMNEMDSGAELRHHT